MARAGRPFKSQGESSMKKPSVGLLLALALLAAHATPVFADGTVVSYIEPRSEINAPPALPLDSFSRFEIEPIRMDAPYAGQDANEAAKARLQADLDIRVNPLLQEWNAKPVVAEPARNLKIEPIIHHIKFISGTVRFFAGGMAGGSAVLMTLKISDADTGEIIAEPEFYQHANKRGAGFTFGATDKSMLVRLSNMMTEYLRTNYSQAVGSAVSVAPEVKD
jgi:hypothetical protein